jgi:hypothetical protein
MTFNLFDIYIGSSVTGYGNPTQVTKYHGTVTTYCFSNHLISGLSAINIQNEYSHLLETDVFLLPDQSLGNGLNAGPNGLKTGTLTMTGAVSLPTLCVSSSHLIVIFHRLQISYLDLELTLIYIGFDKSCRQQEFVYESSDLHFAPKTWRRSEGI